MGMIAQLSQLGKKDLAALPGTIKSEKSSIWRLREHQAQLLQKGEKRGGGADTEP